MRENPTGVGLRENENTTGLFFRPFKNAFMFSGKVVMFIFVQIVTHLKIQGLKNFCEVRKEKLRIRLSRIFIDRISK